MSYRSSIEGRPCRIKDGTAERLMEAFKVLGLSVVCKQTPAALTIDGNKVNAVRSYTTQRALDFDHKVGSIIRDTLERGGVNLKSIQDTHTKINDEIYHVSPAGSQLGSMGNKVNIKTIEKFLEQAAAVKTIFDRPDVQKNLKEYDTLQVLFSGYDEIVKEKVNV